MVGRLLIIAVLIAAGTGKLCYPEYLIHEIDLRPHDRDQTVTHQNIRSPIRIRYHYLNLEITSTEEHYLRTTIVPSADQWISTRLNVNSIVNSDGDIGYWFADDIEECAGVDIPYGIKKYGVWDADLLIFVTASPAPLEESSWGHPCVVDTSSGGLDRVVVGRVWINSTYLSKHDDSDNITNFLQQMTHVMGFHYRTYKYWKTAGGAAYSSVTEKLQDVRGKSVFRITTPTVAQEAASQFACTGLSGVDLEFSGSDEIPGHHWDKRLMYNDYMVRLSENPIDIIFSRISLAALADTNWYTVDLSRGYSLTWGYHKGCEFVENRCIDEHLKSSFSEFWVDTDYVPSCTHNHLHKGVCSITRYVSPIPDPYQYFKDSHIGGADGFLDYCPHVVQFWNGDCRNSDYNRSNDSMKQSFGITSRWVQGTFVPEGDIPHLHSGCYAIACFSDRAVISIGDHEVNCFFNGASGDKTIPGFDGEVVCPDSTILCGNNIPCVNACTGKGMCAFGVWQCDEGWYGVDCSYQCDPICLTCFNSSTTCTSCHPEMVFTGSSCACDSHSNLTTDDNDWFVVPFSRCTSPNNCPIGSEPTNLQTKLCIHPVNPAIRYDFSQLGQSYSSLGYRAGSAGHCNPPWDMEERRGDYYKPELHHSLRLPNLPLYKTYTVEMWIRHEIENVSIVSHEIADNYIFADLWISSCNSLVVDWGWDRFQSKSDELRVFRQNTSLRMWNLISYSVTDDCYGSKIRTYANTLLASIGSSQIKVNQPTQPRDFIGSYKDSLYFFQGFIYNYVYYEFNPLLYTVSSCIECPDIFTGDCYCEWDEYYDNDIDERRCRDCSSSCTGNGGCDDDGCLAPCELTCPSCDEFVVCDSCVCNTISTPVCGCESGFERINDGPCVPICDGTCEYCSGGDPDQCEFCSDDLELQGLAPTTCECAQGDDCTDPAPRRPAEACGCLPGFFWEIDQCSPCDPTCSTCRYEARFCESCADGLFMQQGAPLCLDFCPTGLVESPGVCSRSRQQAVTFNFLNRIAYDWTSNEILLHGGYWSGAKQRDDPVPIYQRGLWFDECNAYQTLLDFTLNNEFTLEFWVKNHKAQYYESLLFGSYAHDQEITNESIVRFAIYDERLVFRDFTHDLVLISDNASVREKKWAHVAVNVGSGSCFERFSGQTLSFYTNGVATDSFSLDSFIIDDPTFRHFIGGIKTQFNLTDRFHGFIAEFVAHNLATSSFQTLNSCVGCTYCGTDRQCFSNCKYDQYDDNGVCNDCNWCCKEGCIRGDEYCDKCQEPTCGDNCEYFNLPSCDDSCEVGRNFCGNGFCPDYDAGLCP